MSKIPIIKLLVLKTSCKTESIKESLMYNFNMKVKFMKYNYTEIFFFYFWPIHFNFRFKKLNSYGLAIKRTTML